MTYGEHQEQVARVLNDLIVEQAQPPHHEVLEILECRRHVVTAITERLRYLGGHLQPRRSRQPLLAAVAHRPLDELLNVVTALPSTTPGPTSPVDLLPGPAAADSIHTVDRWRCAARNLTLGNHELTSSGRQPWTTNDASLWHLVRDMATAVEAVILLDERLSAAGALPAVPHDVHASTLR